MSRSLTGFRDDTGREVTVERATPLPVDIVQSATVPVDLVSTIPLPVTVQADTVPSVNYDAGLRTRVSQLTTLWDGKHLNAAETFLWDSKGTGSDNFANSAHTMSVTANQYVVRQGKFFNPYFSGKSQIVELTFDSFHLQAGVTKRVGYFSSNAVAPYDSDKDGFWLENDGTTYTLCVSNAGTPTLALDWTDWDGYADLASYDWEGFTVILFDFLWLGGAILRLFVKTSSGFVLAHTFNFAGSGETGTFTNSPNQPVRYEIRSTGGAGSFKEICSQVSSEGSLSEVGQSKAVLNTTPIAANSSGTIYALKGIRALAAYRDQAIRLTSYGGLITHVQSDAGVFLLLRNPTLTNPLTWAANGRFEEGTGSATTTVSAVGEILGAFGTVSGGNVVEPPDSILSRLGIGIDNAVDTLIVAYLPTTATTDVAAIMTTYRP